MLAAHRVVGAVSITPDFITRIITMYRTPTSSPYKPETAAWVAPCPHCNHDADWWSGITTTGHQYKMACPQCGEIEWTAT